ncbi:anti-sigma factor family protein [Rhizobium sp. SL86]|uniref:anti-sigma factor family protein n=1 Tax=Rhizobium sp. SL86 TaxID=2995148 RepID=UPI002275F200|nr:anti-sigma factor [Rhizobium sp. SL86]MCY1669170.1 anti-sigma factor [Rhizobium sp. SL86]
MTAHPPAPDEDELHAFADGLLDEARQAAIRLWLADHPHAAKQVADWQAQNDAIRKAFAGHARRTPSDAAMVRQPRPSPRFAWNRVAAACLLFLTGCGTGYLISLTQHPDAAAPLQRTSLPQEAETAYLIYASEKRHPVEVAAEQEAHLAAWLGKRLSYERLAVPDLSRLGFQLVGGRLVPVEGGPGALFMYEDQQGQRLTMLVGRNAENRETSFRFATSGSVETFYWIDNGFGYAVTGEISRDLLRDVAEECYKQFPA